VTATADSKPALPRILLSYRKPKPSQNPFLSLFADSLAGHAEVVYFGWKTALIGRYDVLHIHWPESMVRHSNKLHTALAFVFGVALIARLRLQKKPVIWTRHNLNPHEWRNSLEKLFVRAITKRVGLRIALNESQENPASDVTLLHGDYLPWLEKNHYSPAGVGNELLYFGLLRPYKGVEDLITAYRHLPQGEVKLRAAGQASDPAYLKQLENLAGDASGLTLEARFIEDAELTNYLEQSQLVVLPYKALYNSGSALLALSAHRPILVPRTPSTESLCDEMGPEWVSLFDAPLESEDLAVALLSSARTYAEGPPLARRHWPDIGSLHGDLYSLVRREAKAQRSAWPALVRARVAELPEFIAHSHRNSAPSSVTQLRDTTKDARHER
jgi:beta-1,4-mannosyltransferase